MRRQKNRFYNSVTKIRLGDLMRLIPDDEFVIIFHDLDSPDYREEDAIFNGLAADWWRSSHENRGIGVWRVIYVSPCELPTVSGPVLMIIADF